MAAPVLRVFIDQCVPDSAGKTFERHGHEVIFLRERIATDTPDPLVAVVAVANQAILVSMDADFRKIAARRGVGRRAFSKLSLIKLSCRESQCADRIGVAMTLIYHEWNIVQASNDKRLFVEIMDGALRTNR